MSTGAIILFSLAIAVTIMSIILAVYTKEPEHLFLICIAIISAVIGLVIQHPTPNDGDVKNGKAHYVEQNHIELVNGDTVSNYKTYRIEWNQNTK